MSWYDIRRSIYQLKAEGRYGEALTRLQAVAEAERRQGDVVAAIDASMQESLLLGLVGERDLALARSTWAISQAHAPEHRRRLQEHDAAFSVATAFFIFASSADKQGEMHVDKIHEVLDSAAQFVESVGRPSWRGGGLAERASIAYRREDFDTAVTLLREALELKEQDPDSPGVALQSLRRTLGKYLDEAGRQDEAADLLRRMVGDPRVDDLDRFAAWIYLAANAHKRKDVDEAVAAIEQAQTMARGMSDPQRLTAYGVGVEVWLLANDLERAQEDARGGLEIAERLGTPAALSGALQDAFDTALGRGDLDEAQRHLDRLEPIAASIARTGRSRAQSEADERRERLAKAREG